MATYTLIAQEPGKAAEGGKPADGGFLGGFNPLMLMGLILLFFFVVMWPAQRRAKKQQAEMLANIKPGSKVVLGSGIVATVVKLHDAEGELTVRSDDTKLRVLRSAVVTVRGDETPAVTMTEAKS